jgi:hypothetical protein
MRILIRLAITEIPRSVAILLFASLLSTAQVSDSKPEALVVCPGLLQPETLTSYTFAKATLVSLWYARNSAERATEIRQTAKGTDNYFSWMTVMMRINKTSTNDFVCAKRSVKPFAVKQSGEGIGTAADFLAVVYDAHIDINQRTLALLKKLGNTDQAEVIDQISTLQVERGQRWADLVQPTQLALISLIDLKRTDENGKANRLVITKAQKHILLDWAVEHFPEFKNGAPRNQWSDPAKTAHLYFAFLNGRKCSDE